MKKCSRCKRNKELEEFRRDRTTNDGYSYICKSCAKSRGKQLYEKSYQLKAKQRTRERMERHRQQLNEYLEDKCCERCGEADPVVFEFHHTDPNEKDFTIASALSRRWEAIETELQKCVVLCANCHRRTHYEMER